jgi:radical SAM superfamily enzyme YgiQ (UPF0313 family)
MSAKIDFIRRTGLYSQKMNKRVILIFHSDRDKKLSIDTLPPLGVLSIAAYLEKHGIQTDVIDSSVRSFSYEELRPYDLVGFSVNISNRECSLEAIARIKNLFPDKSLVIGGPLCMSNPGLFLQNPHLDAVFACEGEEALLEYILWDHREPIKGAYIKKGPSFQFQGPREWIKDLDALPFPALHKVDITKYNNYPKKKRPISSMMTSRGCPYPCIYCSHSMGRQWRPRSAENVVAEMKWQVNELGVKEICLFDDNFSLDRKRAERICDLLIEEKVPVTLQFTNGLRVDCLDSDLLAKLKKAGTWLIALAPESGSPEVLKKIKKGFDLSQVLRMERECRKQKIRTFGFFMIGFPFETRDDILETIEFAKRLDADLVEFNKVIPFARTELYEMMTQDGTLLADPSLSAKSYHEGTITTYQVGDLTEGEVKKLIRKAYREYYWRPKKMLGLLRTFSIRDLWGLGIYAIRTKNI